MIIYEVTTDVAPGTVPAYEAYMRDTHIPDVLQTGCFVSATIARSIPGRYRIRYVATSMDVLDKYLGEHSQQFRDDFAAHLGPMCRCRAKSGRNCSIGTAPQRACPDVRLARLRDLSGVV